MKLANKTLAAIDAQIVATAESGHRNHLGASLIGRPCARELWYRFRWTQEEKFDGRMFRLFERGQLEENRFVKFLRDIGCEVHETDPETGKQWRISDCGGHFGGSTDGVAKGLPDLDPEEWFLCEFKTHSAKSFGKLVEKGVRLAKPEHFAQMQVYMCKLELPWALYMAVNKDNDALHCELVAYDHPLAVSMLAKAADIIEATVPPRRVAESPGAWDCKFCSLNRVCHFGDVTPDRNCRTCEHVICENNGTWRCRKMGVSLCNDAQREGCHHYEVNLVLLNRQP